jgi:hypothetical protein
MDVTLGSNNVACYKFYDTSLLPEREYIFDWGAYLADQYTTGRLVLIESVIVIGREACKKL